MEVVVPPPEKMPYDLARCQLMYNVHTVQYLIYMLSMSKGARESLSYDYVCDSKKWSEKQICKAKRSEIFFLFASKRKIRSETMRKQSKKLVLDFRLSKRKQSDTDLVSLRFASKRKNF
jgi:hypothetical protein